MLRRRRRGLPASLLRLLRGCSTLSMTFCSFRIGGYDILIGSNNGSSLAVKVTFFFSSASSPKPAVSRNDYGGYRRKVCGKFVDNKESSLKISETIRHLSVRTTNPDILRKIEKFKHLHSLFLDYKGSNDQDLCKVLIGIFNASRCLRLLYILASEDLEIISEEIGNLMHLRYLKIDCYVLTMLPRSLSDLYHLQCIIYDKPYYGSDLLPSDINNLSNLRYVKLPYDCISSICGIGKLKYLTELYNFVVRDVSGYRIGELENMNDLRILGIYNLENVKDAEEACSAKLYAKRRLTYLALRWHNTDLRNIDLDEKVLDNLQPPKCLRNLKIDGYMGARPAIWMNNVDLISNLEKIELEECLEWETLPPFGQLPFLKSLTLQKMPKVKWLQSKYCTFPLLEMLIISELEALEDWFEAEVAAEDGCCFPCLIQLFIHDVPIRELPNLPPSLKRLTISNCHPELFERYGKVGGSDGHKIAHIPNIYVHP